MKKILFALLLFSAVTAKSQNRFIDSFDVYHTAPQIASFLDVAISGNAYRFQGVRDRLGAWTDMYRITHDMKYFNVLKNFLDTLIYSSRVSNTIPGNVYAYQDTYRTWIDQYEESEVYMSESELHEGYIANYIFMFLREAIKNNVQTTWAQNRLSWFTQNMWTKIRTRSQRRVGPTLEDRLLLQIRIHMGSHFSTVAQILAEISPIDSIRQQAKAVVDQYDILVGRNLRSNPANPELFIWNATYDDASGTDGRADLPSVIQDISHGNHVINYMVFANEMGNPKYPLSVMRRMAATTKALYRNNFTFFDMVDGTIHPTRPGNWGNYQADGFVKLGRYDSELFDIHKSILDGDSNAITNRYNQTFNYRSSLALTQYHVNSGSESDTTKKYVEVVSDRNRIAYSDSSAKLDKIEGATIRGRKMSFIYTGDYTAANLGIYDDANSSLAFQKAFDSSNVGSIWLTNYKPLTYIWSGGNANGKKIRFGNGCRISLSNTVSNLVIEAGDNDYIIEGTPTFINLKTPGGYISAAWFGVTENDLSRLAYANQVAIAAGLPLKLPAGTYKASENIVVITGTHIFGDDSTRINFVQGFGITTANNSVNTITLRNLKFSVTDTGAGNGVAILNFNNAGVRYGIHTLTLEKIEIDGVRKSSSPVFISGLKYVKIDDLKIKNAQAHGLYMRYCDSVQVNNYSGQDFGINGLRLETEMSNVVMNNLDIKRPMKTGGGGNGGIDIRTVTGPILLDGLKLLVDSSANPAATPGGIFLTPAWNTTIRNAEIIMGGRAPLYGIQQSTTSGNPPSKGNRFENVVIINKDVLMQRAYQNINAYDFTLIGGYTANDSNITSGNNQKLASFGSQTVVDTVTKIEIRDHYYKSMGRSDYLIQATTVPYNEIVIDNLRADSLPGQFMFGGPYRYGIVKVTNSRMKIQRANEFYNITSFVSSFVHNNNEYVKPDTVISVVDGAVSSQQRTNVVNGKLLYEAGSSGPGGSVAWADVTGKPSTFTPSTHTHPATDVTGLAAAITSANNFSFGRNVSDDSLVININGTRYAVLDKTASGPGGSVAWADVTGKPSTFAPSAHNHNASDINAGVLNPGRLASGTPSGSNVPFGDGTYKNIYTQAQTNTQIENAIDTIKKVVFGPGLLQSYDAGTNTVTVRARDTAGTYTPTFTPGTNSPSFTLNKAIFTRVANVVTVDIMGYLTVGAATATGFTLSLPISSNVTGSYDVFGTVDWGRSVSHVNTERLGYIYTDSGYTAGGSFTPGSTGGNITYIHFQYEVK